VEYTFKGFILLPIGLGLLGFIEPCTIGGHLLFLNTQKNRSMQQRFNAVTSFIAVRSLATGFFGALIALLGQRLIGVQSSVWFIFGLIYLALGLAFVTGKSGLIKRKINLAPAAWKRASNPVLLGLAFGLNIPACAAPILFGLLGLAATSGAIVSGFVMMFLFGLSLSLPLAVFTIVPTQAEWLAALAQRATQIRWLVGLVFVALGAWSIWFGLYVDPADWAGT
jgi:cytochrome c-type biogenesis protein